MKNAKIIFILLILTLSISLTNAQTSIFTIAYSTGSLLGETADYIGDYSWRGISIEERYFVERDMSVGFYLGWNVFNKTLVNYTQPFDNAVLYGNQYRYINAWPILVNAHYHFLREEVIRPYIGGGVGVYSVNRRTEMGLYASSVKTWQFGFQPEAGIWIDMADGLNLMLAAKYNYALKTSKGDALSFININFGLSFVY